MASIKPKNLISEETPISLDTRPGNKVVKYFQNSLLKDKFNPLEDVPGAYEPPHPKDMEVGSTLDPHELFVTERVRKHYPKDGTGGPVDMSDAMVMAFNDAIVDRVPNVELPGLTDNPALGNVNPRLKDAVRFLLPQSTLEVPFYGLDLIDIIPGPTVASAVKALTATDVLGGAGAGAILGAIPPGIRKGISKKKAKKLYHGMNEAHHPSEVRDVVHKGWIKGRTEATLEDGTSLSRDPHLSVGSFSSGPLHTQDRYVVESMYSSNSLTRSDPGFWEDRLHSVLAVDPSDEYYREVLNLSPEAYASFRKLESQGALAEYSDWFGLNIPHSSYHELESFIRRSPENLYEKGQQLKLFGPQQYLKPRYLSPEERSVISELQAKLNNYSEVSRKIHLQLDSSNFGALVPMHQKLDVNFSELPKPNDVMRAMQEHLAVNSRTSKTSNFPDLAPILKHYDKLRNNALIQRPVAQRVVKLDFEGPKFAYAGKSNPSKYRIERIEDYVTIDSKGKVVVDREKMLAQLERQRSSIVGRGDIESIESEPDLNSIVDNIQDQYDNYVNGLSKKERLFLKEISDANPKYRLMWDIAKEHQETVKVKRQAGAFVSHYRNITDTFTDNHVFYAYDADYYGMDEVRQLISEEDFNSTVKNRTWGEVKYILTKSIREKYKEVNSQTLKLIKKTEEYVVPGAKKRGRFQSRHEKLRKDPGPYLDQILVKADEHVASKTESSTSMKNISDYPNMTKPMQDNYWSALMARAEYHDPVDIDEQLFFLNEAAKHLSKRHPGLDFSESIDFVNKHKEFLGMLKEKNSLYYTQLISDIYNKQPFTDELATYYLGVNSIDWSSKQPLMTRYVEKKGYKHNKVIEAYEKDKRALEDLLGVERPSIAENLTPVEKKPTLIREPKQQTFGEFASHSDNLTANSMQSSSKIYGPDDQVPYYASDVQSIDLHEFEQFEASFNGQNTSFMRTGSQQGSNPGGWYSYESKGNSYEAYVKFPYAVQQVPAEVASEALAREMGLPTKKSQARSIGGKWAVISKKAQINTLTPRQIKTHLDSEPQRKQITASYVHAAWVGNWDLVGLEYDNLVNFVNGKNILGDFGVIDHGGTFFWRAQGGMKPGGFPAELPVELKSLRDVDINPQSTNIYSYLTDEEIAFSIRDTLPDITDDDIARVLKDVKFDKKYADDIYEALKVRRDKMIKWADDILQDESLSVEEAVKEGASFKSIEDKLEEVALKPTNYKKEIEDILDDIDTYEGGIE